MCVSCVILRVRKFLCAYVLNGWPLTVFIIWFNVFNTCFLIRWNIKIPIASRVTGSRYGFRGPTMYLFGNTWPCWLISTVQKMKFCIKDFFSKCDQIRRELWIWSHLLKKSLMENFIVCAMQCAETLLRNVSYNIWSQPCVRKFSTFPIKHYLFFQPNFVVGFNGRS